MGMNHPTVSVDSEESNESDGFLLVGPTGAGKTAALEAVQENIPNSEMHAAEFDPIDMGDMARDIHSEEFRDTPDEETPSVSEWAGDLKESDGPAWLAERIIDRFHGFHTTYGVSPVIAGVRSLPEKRAFEGAYGDMTTIWLWSDVFTRYERVAHGRNGRNDMTPGEFFERDYREYRWGLGELTQRGVYDVWLHNQHSLEEFKSAVRNIVFGKMHEWGVPDDELIPPWQELDDPQANEQEGGFSISDSSSGETESSGEFP